MDVDRGAAPIAQGEPKTSGMALSSMILGITSFLCSIFTGIPAIILGAVSLGSINNSRGQVTGRGMAITGIVTGCISTFLIVPLTLVALLLPAIQAAREAARRNQSSMQMKQIAIAMLNYEMKNKALPAPGGPGAKSQLSWRVHMLPYLESEALYRQFHLDEPWDSPHNRTLIAQMPEVFKSPTGQYLPPGHTTYLLPTGPGTAFPDADTAPTIRSFVDGTSNSIILVEADAIEAVEWTKPDDWQFNPNDPMSGLGHMRYGGFLVLSADTAVHFIENDTDTDTFRAMLTPAGREVIPLR